jgi:hypothetical protein
MNEVRPRFENSTRINVPKNDVLIERHFRSEGRSGLQSEGADGFNIIETWPIDHKIPDAVRLVTEYKRSKQPCNSLLLLVGAFSGGSGRQLLGLRQYGFKFDAWGGIPRVVLERIHTILGSPTCTSPHDDAAKEHNPENPTRLRVPRVRAALLSSKNCV